MGYPTPRRYPTAYYRYEMSSEPQWAVTSPDVVREAVLAEGFCPEGCGPLQPGAHYTVYAWCPVCEVGWAIQAVFMGDGTERGIQSRVDIDVTAFAPGHPEGQEWWEPGPAS